MKISKRLLLLLTMLMCFTLGTFHVTAADDLLGTVVDGSLLTNNTESDYIVYPRQRGSYLSNGSGHIVLEGPRSVTISGSTTAYQTVDKVKVTLYLERLQNGNWVNVKILGPKTNSNAYYVSNSSTYSVTGGYFYRVTGSHTVIHNGVPESISSATDGVWVP